MDIMGTMNAGYSIVFIVRGLLTVVLKALRHE